MADRLACGRVGVERVSDRTLVHHDDLVAQREEFFEIFADEQDPDTGCGLLDQNLLNGCYTLHVESAGWLGSDQHGRFAVELAADEEALKVSAR